MLFNLFVYDRPQLFGDNYTVIVDMISTSVIYILVSTVRYLQVNE